MTTTAAAPEPFCMVYPHDYKSPLSKVEMRIDDNMVDVSQWKHKHPGGAEIIDKFHNADATEAFYSLHSKDAVQKMKRMPSRPCDASSPKRDAVSVNFERLRKELEEQGWYQRSLTKELLYYFLPCMLLIFGGQYLSYTYPVLAALFIGLGMQQAGWLGHDYTHGRDNWSAFGRIVLSVVNGFSQEWWSQKHNCHHTFPNRMDVDSDIHNEPIIHLWFPKKGADVWYRKYQHIYFPFAYSFLYVSWRIQSIQFVIGSGNNFERAQIILGYLWLFTLPLNTALLSVLIGGFLVAIIVTANHQVEPFLEKNAKYNYVADQFITTRDVRTDDVVSEYVFGAMQYQLEHHLFPTMPKHNYPMLRKRVAQFAKENGLPYNISPVMEIFRMNFEVMRKASL